MKKKEEKTNPLGTVKNLLTLNKHPVLNKKWSFGERASDFLTAKMGSWGFILLFLVVLVFWMWINAYYLIEGPFDPYPFILLNLVLSCLAAIQAPIILMSQNREAQKDRLKSQYDYQVNRRSLREINELKKQLNKIEKKLSKK